MKTFYVIFLVLLSGFVQAETLKNKNAAKDLAKSAMDMVAKGETEKGIELTRPYLIIPEHEFEGMLNALRMQAPAIEQRFGKTLSTELAAVEEVGESLMLVMYIQKFEKHLMRWKFYFYKPKDSWVLNTFNTDDKIQMMFNNI